MFVNDWQGEPELPQLVEVTDDQVRQARLIIQSMMPGQATNIDAVLLAGVAHALAVQEQQRRPALHH